MLRALEVATYVWAAVLAGLLLATTSAHAEAHFSGDGAQACIDCHDSPNVMGIVDTVHADAEKSRTPASEKECQSCHGPSATHIQFPMQVENLHFGKESKAKPEKQNQACLECHHEDADRTQWEASAHGYEELVCSTCHSIHDPEKLIPTKAKVSSGCSVDGCHATLMDGANDEKFTHAVGEPLGENGGLTCADCHNPHGPLSSSRCLECHSQEPEVLAKESEKAKRFHEVAERKGTSCIRCHKGIAHPIPPLLNHEAEAPEMEAPSKE